MLRSNGRLSFFRFRSRRVTGFAASSKDTSVLSKSSLGSCTNCRSSRKPLALDVLRERPVVQIEGLSLFFCGRGFSRAVYHFFPRRFTMQKQNLTRAHKELFRRSSDEQFESLAALSAF